MIDKQRLMSEKFDRFVTYQKDIIDEENYMASFILVSDTNDVHRKSVFGGEDYIERIDINGIDYSRLNSVFYNHNLDELPIAKTTNIRVEEGKLKADIVFDKEDKKARFVFDKVKNGYINGISVGYAIKEVEIDQSNETKVLNAKRVEVFEASITPIPADKFAVMGRNIQEVEVKNEINNEAGSEKMENESLAIERDRVKNIREFAKNYGCENEGDEFITSGRSVEDFKSYILDTWSNKEQNHVRNKSVETSKVQNLFNINKAIAALVTGERSEASYEFEVSKRMADEHGLSSRGLHIPGDTLIGNVRSRMNRTDENVLSKVGENTGQLVNTTTLASSFIDILRENSLIDKLGVRSLRGLRDDIQIPRRTSPSSAFWIDDFEDEETEARDTTQRFDMVKLSLKTVAASQRYTRKMLIQSNPYVGDLVMNDMAYALSMSLDKAVFAGSGKAGEPQGVIGADGVSFADVPHLSWAAITEAQEVVETANNSLADMCWVGSPYVKAKLRSTAKEAGYPEYLMNDSKTLDGLPFYSTNLIPRDVLILGNWREVLVGYWNGLEIQVDKSIKSKAGSITLNAFYSADVAIRHPESFYVIKGVK